MEDDKKVVRMVCMVCFDVCEIIRFLKATKRSASRSVKWLKTSNLSLIRYSSIYCIGTALQHTHCAVTSDG